MDEAAQHAQQQAMNQMQQMVQQMQQQQQEMQAQMQQQAEQIRSQAEQLAQQNEAGRKMMADTNAAMQREVEVRRVAEEAVNNANEAARKAKEERDEARASGGIVDTRQVSKVHTFDGSRKNFHAWSVKFKSYMACMNGGADDAMDWAEQQKVVLNEDVIDAKNTKWQWISKQIYHVMMQLVQGDAFSIVMNTTSRNGLEAWRKMIAHYEPDTRGTQRERLTELLKPNVCPELSKLTTALESFEREVAEYATKYKR